MPKATHLWVNEMKGCSWHGSLSSIDIMYSPAALLYELLNPMHGVCVPLFSSQLVGRDLQNFDEVQKSRFDFLAGERTEHRLYNGRRSKGGLAI